MNDLKKVSVPICCICQKVINGDAEWTKTKRGTVLYMHRECVRKGKENEDQIINSGYVPECRGTGNQGNNGISWTGGKTAYTCVRSGSTNAKNSDFAQNRNKTTNSP